MVSEPTMTNKETIKILEEIAIQKYDEEDEYALLSNNGIGTLLTHVQLRTKTWKNGQKQSRRC